MYYNIIYYTSIVFVYTFDEPIQFGAHFENILSLISIQIECLMFIQVECLMKIYLIKYRII